MKVAYQGQPGAFGHEACLKFLPDHEPVPVPTFADVASAVADGGAQLGILPVENSCAGPVEEARKVIGEAGLSVVATHRLPVRMHLLAVPGATLETVRTVSSHPVALAQSARTLAGLGLTPEPAANTAIAAKALASSGDKSIAVLASEAAATLYGLSILRRDVHDQADNVTTFCVMAASEG